MNPHYIYFLNLLARKMSLFDKIKDIPNGKDKILMKETIDMLIKYDYEINENNLDIEYLNLKQISELLYSLKAIIILKSLNKWDIQGRKIRIEKYKRGKINEQGEKIILDTDIYLITTESLNHIEFKFHIPEENLILDSKSLLEDSPYYEGKKDEIHYSKTYKKKQKTKLPFSDLEWLKKIL